MRWILVSVAVLLHFTGCSAPADANGEPTSEVVIYYLSFGVDTFTPVTTELIEKRADCRFVLASDTDRVRDLTALLERAVDGSFDNRVVRVKAIGLASAPTFVDIDGGLLRGSEEKKLPEPAFAALESMLEAMANREACKQ